jgi:hypothetical protein
MKMEQTECSETSAYKIQTSGNYPEESIQHVQGFLHVGTLLYLSIFNLLKYISLICHKSVTTQNLAFLIYRYRKKRLQVHI